MKYGAYFGSLYSLSIFLLKFPEKVAETEFIFFEKMPISLEKKIKYDYIDYKINKKIKNKLLLFILYQYEGFLTKKKLKPLLKYDIKFGQDHLSNADFLLDTKKDFILFEDGDKNYTGIKKIKNLRGKKSFYTFIKYRILNKTFFPYGMDERIKKIYLTGIKETPKDIEKKVELISLKNEWKKKSNIEKINFLSYFGLDKRKMELYSKKKVLILTQCLSEDKVIPEEEKIKLYKNILLKYNEDEVLIKTHPRETTNYRILFPRVMVIEEIFPSYILTLLDIKFDVVETLFSNAILEFSSDHIIYHGSTVNKKFVERYGKSYYDKKKCEIIFE